MISLVNDVHSQEEGHRMLDTHGALIGQGRTAEIYAWGDSEALKLYYAGWPASAAAHEADIGRALAGTGLPVPAVGRALEVDGRYGLLFERITGPSLLQQFSAKPWTVTESLRVFTDLHLTIHTESVAGLPSQREQLTRLITEAGAVSGNIRT